MQKRNDFLVPNRKELQNRCETITDLIVDVMLAPWYQFLTLCPFEPISQLELRYLNPSLSTGCFFFFGFSQGAVIQLF